MSTFVLCLVVVGGAIAAAFASGPVDPFQPATVGGEGGRGDIEPPRPPQPVDPGPPPHRDPPQRPTKRSPVPAPEQMPEHVSGAVERVSVWRRLRSMLALLVLLCCIGALLAGAIAVTLFLLNTALQDAAGTS